MNRRNEVNEYAPHHEGDLTEIEKFCIDQKAWRRKFEASMSQKYQKFTEEINTKLGRFFPNKDGIEESSEIDDKVSHAVSEIKNDFETQFQEFDEKIKSLALILQNQIKDLNYSVNSLENNVDYLSRSFASEIQSMKSFINGTICNGSSLSMSNTTLQSDQQYQSSKRASSVSDSLILRPLINKDIFSYIWDGNIKGVEYVLRRDPSSVYSRKGVADSTALMVAAVKGNIDICKLLIAKGAQVNERDKNGRTALILSASPWCPVSLCKFLIESGADINIKAKNGETVLSCARNCCKHELVYFLEALGARD